MNNLGFWPRKKKSAGAHFIVVDQIIKIVSLF